MDGGVDPCSLRRVGVASREQQQRWRHAKATRSGGAALSYAVGARQRGRPGRDIDGPRVYDGLVSTAADKLRERALVPRYTVQQAASVIGRRPQRVRRWAFGYSRVYRDRPVHDEPLIVPDGDVGAVVALSLTNLLELRMLSIYRGDVSLQAIRRALEFAATAMHEPRPLITVKFRAISGDLFTKFAATQDGRDVLVNASRSGQFVIELAGVVDTITADVDYESEVARQWWYRGRDSLVVIDTAVAAGQPITSESGVRVSAIRSRKAEGFSRKEIARDTGASGSEVAAAMRAAA